MGTAVPLRAGLVFAFALGTVAAQCTGAGHPDAGDLPAHPWKDLVAALGDVGEAAWVATDEAAVRAVVGTDAEARQAALGTPLPEQPFGEVERLEPGLDLAPILGFDLGDVRASLTVEGLGTAYQVASTPTAEQLTELGWAVAETGEGFRAEPDAVDLPHAGGPVTRVLSQPMLVRDGVVLVGAGLATAPEGAAPASPPPAAEAVDTVLRHVAAHDVETAVVVFDGYRTQRPYAPQPLEHFPVGAVAAAGAVDDRRLMVALWQDSLEAAETNAVRLADWLDWFVANTVALDDPVSVDQDGHVVLAHVSTNDPEVLLTLHRHRGLPIGSESPRRE